jgi:hypothetical protein
MSTHRSRRVRGNSCSEVSAALRRAAHAETRRVPSCGVPRRLPDDSPTSPYPGDSPTFTLSRRVRGDSCSVVSAALRRAAHAETRRVPCCGVPRRLPDDSSTSPYPGDSPTFTLSRRVRGDSCSVVSAALRRAAHAETRRVPSCGVPRRLPDVAESQRSGAIQRDSVGASFLLRQLVLP